MTSEMTEKIRGDWDSQADAWYAHADGYLKASRPIHGWLVENLAPSDGQTILELAAGPGDTGFLAAPRLGDGLLLSTDISSAMVDAARKRAAELGITNAQFRILDAQAMDLDDDSVDGILCRWGFMLMPDPVAALRECHRVLKPGGKLSFAVFTGPEENPFAAVPAGVLRERGHMPTPSGTWQPGILALGDRALLEKTLADAGFAWTPLERVDMTWRFTDEEDFWRFLVDLTAMGPLVRSLGEADRRDVREAIARRLEAFTTADGIALPSRCWCGVAIAT